MWNEEKRELKQGRENSSHPQGLPLPDHALPKPLSQRTEGMGSGTGSGPTHLGSLSAI